MEKEIKNIICDSLKNFSDDSLIEILETAKIHVYKCVECSDPQQGLDIGSICVDYTIPNILGTEWEEII